MLNELLAANPIADGDTASGTLGIAIVSGIVTIIVSFLGLFGTRRKKDPVPAPVTPVPVSPEDKFLAYLENELAIERQENAELKAENSRLVRLCIAHEVNPTPPSERRKHEAPPPPKA